MAKVLVTGVGGFTGRYVAQALVARGHDVIGMARSADEPQVPEVSKTYLAELSDKAMLTEMIAQAKPDRVIHLAAISFVSHGDTKEMYDANLIGTANLLQACVDAKCTLSNILLASSANIYGNGRSGQLDEDIAPLPANHYGISKLATEHLGRIYLDRLPITIVRPFNYTGVGQAVNFVVPKIIDHARRGQSKIELGSLDVARDFSDVRAVADSYIRLIERPEAVGQTFNVCSAQAYKLRDVIRMVEAISGIAFDISVNPAFVREGEIKTLFGSRNKLEAVIGPLQMPPFDETLSWMFHA
ncbi:NAD-dependent epimerase/dehydratase family protein [Sphingomonas crocodyli]|uniref:NAD-dependent epimerase/dehydratase family protein n=1 Tax=Sphingomonas crocodyli TaxID=1979270 RepID=A0A437MBE9_9SPHN|nr:NAD-dependent epimerase/dehydratase family protein [Sphingomonas crocodyli]RVT94946.1 NAD-dependent epimerase/dehydratase family protein [Sphingomonas crocodyli]